MIRPSRRLVRFLVTSLSGAAVVAAVTIPPAWGTNAAVSPGIGQVMVGHDVNHMTSAPLRSISPSHSGSPHPHAPGSAHAARPASPYVVSPDTSGRSSVVTPRIPSASVNFDGSPDNSGVIPPDDDGAIGATQFVELVNSQITVYNKSGGVLLGPENTNTLWSGFGGGCQTNNDGDGTILWDPISSRWFVQQFSVSMTPYLDCVAISSTSDATGTWHLYSFQFTNFPDYPKTGVWPDAYYATFNTFNAAGTQGLGEETCAFSRASMLTGAAATSQCFMLTASGETTVLPATMDGTTQPAAGAQEYLVAISPTTSNALAVWRLHVDWTTPANSALSAQPDLGVSAFSEACGGAGTCVPQSGTSQQLDSLGDRLMFRLQYRNFGDHEALVVTHSVVAGSSVGMRWYELRPSGSSLSVFQSGTYAPDATYRWMGSIAMDASGDMALGFSTSSSSLHPGLAYTGRLAGDPAGAMPQGESTIFTGAGSQSAVGQAANRWGDYSEMTVDPTDNCTFWYVNEYLPSNGDFNWHTRIGAFKFPSCGGTVTNDFSISANPTSVTVSQGGSGTSTITTAITSGSAQAVTLSASGLPSGVTASFNPTSITGNGSSTLTLSASASATTGTTTVTVTGTGTSATHSTSVSLTVNPSGGGGGGITNGDFESGLTGWTSAGTTASDTSSSTTPVHTGTHAAQVGSTSPSTDSSLAQTFTVPSGSTQLSFSYFNFCPDSVTYDWATVTLKDNTANTTTTPLAKTCNNPNSGSYKTVTASVTAGHSYTLTLSNHDDNYASPPDPTYTMYDSVALNTTAPTNDFSISASPASISENQGASGTSTISTAVTTGAAQTVNLSISGLPSGASAAFNPTSVTAGGSSTLTVTAATNTPAGTYTLTVTGTGTSATHTTTVSLTVVANNFSISASPTSLSLDPGQSGTSTIATSLVSGSAQTITLSATGAPSGATATLNPTSVTTGASSTLTVATATSTPPGTYTITVTGTAPSATHSTTVTLTVNGVGGTVVQNGGFEAGSLSPWAASGPAPAPSVSTAQAHGGTHSALLGASSGAEPNGDDSLTQTVTVPAGTSTLTFWYWPSTTDSITYDWQEAQIRNTSGTTLASVFKVCSNAHAWTQVTFDMSPYAGTSVQLWFNDHQDGYGDLTYYYLDDVAITATAPPPPPPALTQLSADTFTDANAEHATEVEPDTLSNGQTIVSVFQVGRFNNGGSDDTGWATSTNGGSTWSHGILPGLTTVGGGTNLGWARVSDPAIAYDPRHGVWIASSLTIDSAANGRGVAVNRSTDGVTWQAATNAISQTADFFDKDWIACDQTSTSPSYGNCYIEFDDNTLSNTVQMLTSTDGGVTWSAARGTADTAHGLGGQPLVQPNGTVVVPYLADSAAQIRAFTSTNGGSSWGSSVLISSETTHTPAGGFRTSPMPTAEIDAAGTVYVAWQDCRFRSGCTSNDIVMSTSSNGTTWSAVSRIPIDATTSGADHFVPGLAVDRATSGASAHLGLYYYYYPSATCNPCSLDVGFVSSANGGSTWSAGTLVAGPFALTTIAPTNQGPMVGDYMSASFSGGRAYGVFAVGVPASGTLNEAMYTVTGGLSAPGGHIAVEWDTGAHGHHAPPPGGRLATGENATRLDAY